MAIKLTCPSCGAKDLDICAYDSMMVLREDTAMFTVRCAHCNTLTSSIHTIPSKLRDEIRFAAIELDAGMGQER